MFTAVVAVAPGAVVAPADQAADALAVEIAVPLSELAVGERAGAAGGAAVLVTGGLPRDVLAGPVTRPGAWC